MNEVVDTLDGTGILKSILIGVLIAGAILFFMMALPYGMQRMQLHFDLIENEKRIEQRIRHSEMLKSAGLDPNECGD